MGSGLERCTPSQTADSPLPDGKSVGEGSWVTPALGPPGCSREGGSIQEKSSSAKCANLQHWGERTLSSCAEAANSG